MIGNGCSCGKSEATSENIGDGALALDRVPTRYGYWVVTGMVDLPVCNGNWCWISSLSSLLMLVGLCLGCMLVGIDIMAGGPVH